MGANPAPAATWQNPAQEELVVRFACLMWKRYRARVYLFGSRARGTANAESDYDIVTVAPSFEGQRRIARALDRYQLWHEAGGWGVALDLHCYTPEEFRAQLAGLGYLHYAKERGELIKVDTRDA